jgi:hypothetical protein
MQIRRNNCHVDTDIIQVNWLLYKFIQISDSLVKHCEISDFHSGDYEEYRFL